MAPPSSIPHLMPFCELQATGSTRSAPSCLGAFAHIIPATRTSSMYSKAPASLHSAVILPLVPVHCLCCTSSAESLCLSSCLCSVPSENSILWPWSPHRHLRALCRKHSWCEQVRGMCAGQSEIHVACSTEGTQAQPLVGHFFREERRPLKSTPGRSDGNNLPVHTATSTGCSCRSPGPGPSSPPVQSPPGSLNERS